MNTCFMNVINSMMICFCSFAVGSCITPDVSISNYGYNRLHECAYRHHIGDAMIPEKLKLPIPNRVPLFKPRPSFPEIPNKPQFILIRKPEHRNKNIRNKNILRK